jgi:FlgD Ig-like domain
VPGPLGAVSAAPAGPAPTGDAPPLENAPPGGGGRRALVLSLVTLLLIAGASLGFLRAQELKLERSPFTRPRVERAFSPACDCPTKETATLAFTVRAPVRVDAEIADATGRPVRSLVSGASWSPGRRTLQWDGRDDRGRVVSDGDYRLRLTLLEGGREIVVPTPVRVDTRRPRATLTGVSPHTLKLSATEAPPMRPIDVRYRASESAHPLLLVDGRTATRRGSRPAGRSVLKWGGKVRGRRVALGTYMLAVRLRDRAGNLGPPSRSARVRVLAPRRGGR